MEMHLLRGVDGFYHSCKSCKKQQFTSWLIIGSTKNIATKKGAWQQVPFFDVLKKAVGMGYRP